MYEIVIKKQAIKVLLRLPKPVSNKFRLAFKALAINPDSLDYDVGKLVGREGYRLRLAGYRAIYTIDRNNMVIQIIKIGSRGDVYK